MDNACTTSEGIEKHLSAAVWSQARDKSRGSDTTKELSNDKQCSSKPGQSSDEPQCERNGWIEKCASHTVEDPCCDKQSQSKGQGDRSDRLEEGKVSVQYLLMRLMKLTWLSMWVAPSASTVEKDLECRAVFAPPKERTARWRYEKRIMLASLRTPLTEEHSSAYELSKGGKEIVTKRHDSL